jgi:short-subunit dehydrogenase
MRTIMATETVLITGASSGIGLELAKLFAADKCNLVLVARNQAALENLAAELRRAEGVDVAVLPRDLADPSSPRAIFDELAGQGRSVDVVVNNAGFGDVVTLVDSDPQKMLDMIQVNIAALTHLTCLFLPGIAARGRGGILNVGSTAGFQPGPHMAVYYATKAYVLSFTEALAEELAGSKISVTCLAPGPTATGFAAAAHEENTLLFRMGMMDAKKVARAGYRGFRRGQVLVVPGLGNNLLAFSIRFAPRFVVRKIVKFLQTPAS